MIKRLLILGAILLVAGSAFAFTLNEWAYSSGEKTDDAGILTGGGYFQQLIVMPDGTNDVTVSVYDNTSAAGTEILPTMTFAGDGGAQATPPVWIRVVNGIYVDVTTAGTVAYTVNSRGD